MYQSREIQLLILTNWWKNLEKSKYQFRQINVTARRHPFNNFDKSNLNKIKKEQWLSHGVTDKARQWFDLGPIKMHLLTELSLYDLYKANILKSKLYMQVGGPEQDQDEHVLYIQWECL